MEFFNELQGKLTQASKVVAHKTKEVADVTKLKVQISSEERKIDELYRAIGKRFFRENPDSEEFAEEINAIKASLHIIASCKDEIVKRKGVVVCPECGAENPSNASFCNVCGAKYEAEAEMFEESESPVSSESKDE